MEHRAPVPPPAVATYRRVPLESAPPRRLLQALYARLHGDLELARQAIHRGDAAARERAVDHALAVLVMLEAALDHAAAPQLCANLAAAYAFAFTRILTGSAELDPARLAEAEEVLRPISEAFGAAIDGPCPAPAAR